MGASHWPERPLSRANAAAASVSGLGASAAKREVVRSRGPATHFRFIRFSFRTHNERARKKSTRAQNLFSAGCEQQAPGGDDEGMGDHRSANTARAAVGQATEEAENGGESGEAPVGEAAEGQVGEAEQNGSEDEADRIAQAAHQQEREEAAEEELLTERDHPQKSEVSTHSDEREFPPDHGRGVEADQTEGPSED